MLAGPWDRAGFRPRAAAARRVISTGDELIQPPVSRCVLPRFTNTNARLTVTAAVSENGG